MPHRFIHIFPFEQITRVFSNDMMVGNAIIDGMVDINTVDGFQGREKDVIIFSCVRANGGSGIGFLEDIRRMNVGLTRAKYSLWVVGNETSLRASQPWSRFIDHCHIKRSIIKLSDPLMHLDGV